jgi:hypothetical protein
MHRMQAPSQHLSRRSTWTSKLRAMRTSVTGLRPSSSVQVDHLRQMHGLDDTTTSLRPDLSRMCIQRKRDPPGDPRGSEVFISRNESTQTARGPVPATRSRHSPVRRNVDSRSGRG